jgi:hypothetical protein
MDFGFLRSRNVGIVIEKRVGEFVTLSVDDGHSTLQLHLTGEYGCNETTFGSPGGH